MKFTGGLPETACGYGSTLRATETVRAELPGLLRRLGIRTLLDAPCGDLNWISTIDLGVTYIGADVSDMNIAAARRRAPHLPVARLDILNEALPRVDAVLCRDFLQHLPNAEARRALANITATGAKWLIATSHDADANADIEAVGSFRPLNLKIAPLDLGEPSEAIEDGPGRILGAWALC
jgi:hypothetical protein